MWNLFETRHKHTISSPVKGNMIPLTSVCDIAFASKAMGDGLAIIPASDTFVSPIDGTIMACFPTGHAYGIVNDTQEVLVHIGIDTVELKGEGFHSFVKQGDSVHKGDVLVEVDVSLLIQKGYDTTTMLVLTNGKTPIFMKDEGMVEEGEDIAYSK